MKHAVFCALFLTACAGLDDEQYYRGYILPSTVDKSVAGEELPSAKLSQQNPLRLGDTFVFNNPAEIWSVSSITKHEVTWESPTGSYMRTAAVTFLPPLEWGGDASVTDSGRRELLDLDFSGDVAALKNGSVYSYTEVRRNDRPPSVTTAKWECQLGGGEEIVVAAGKTTAIPITCKQNGIERLLLNYSPALGYVVRHVLSTTAGPVVRELSAYQRVPTAYDR